MSQQNHLGGGFRAEGPFAGRGRGVIFLNLVVDRAGPSDRALELRKGEDFLVQACQGRQEFIAPRAQTAIKTVINWHLDWYDLRNIMSRMHLGGAVSLITSRTKGLSACDQAVIRPLSGAIKPLSKPPFRWGVITGRRVAITLSERRIDFQDNHKACDFAIRGPATLDS